MKSLNDNELIIVAIRSTTVVFIVLLLHRPINWPDHFPKRCIIRQGM